MTRKTGKANRPSGSSVPILLAEAKGDDFRRSFSALTQLVHFTNEPPSKTACNDFSEILDGLIPFAEDKDQDWILRNQALAVIVNIAYYAPDLVTPRHQDVLETLAQEPPQYSDNYSHDDAGPAISSAAQDALDNLAAVRGEMLSIDEANVREFNEMVTHVVRRLCPNGGRTDRG